MKKKIKVKALEGTPFLISPEQQIGSGSYGRVVRAYKKDQPSLQLVSKIIPIVSQNKETILSQVKILKQIPHHENLVNCLKFQISSEHNFYLIMEYCNGGSFEKYIMENQNCNEEIIWRFIREFVNGYRVLYDCHVVHRDIKPENIMLHNGKFKIADFGLSRSLNHHGIQQNLSVKGTPLYIAPELHEESVGNSKIDVFSFGIVVYRLAYNSKHPFYDENKLFKSVDEYFQHLKMTALKFPKYPKRSQQLTQLISQCLQKNPVSRISWKQIFDHPKIKPQKTQSSSSQNPQEQEENKQKSEDLVNLRKSIIQIGRSSANIDVLNEPFNHREEIGSEIDRLIQFTQFLPAIEIRGLEIYVTRTKVIIQLVKYLNGKLRYIVADADTGRKKLRIATLMQQVIKQGYIYIEHSLHKLQQILQKYESQLPNKALLQPLLQSLHNEHRQVLQELQKQSIPPVFEHLRYENTLYDFLTEYCELKPHIKQKLKIPTLLMVDLYDGLLKLESIVCFKEQGKIQVIQIQLQDAQLDKIDYANLDTYQKYLDEVNQVTVGALEGRMKSMGLIII